jgi:N-acetylmuramoyl-L-alanine amidase
MKLVISSGHGKYVRGASGVLDEVDEARRVVEEVAEWLREAEVEVITYHDDVSKSQSENLNRICDYHNSQVRDYDVSIHFNAYVETEKPMGTECLYVSQKGLAEKMAKAVSAGGQFINRGAKKRTDLAFLNKTAKPAILIEVCFVDSEADADLYKRNFDLICEEISRVFYEAPRTEPAPAPPLPEEVLLKVKGRVSWFGGPNDTGVSPSEGLAFIYDYSARPDLFLSSQPPGTSGLARRLNPDVYYIACRWDYNVTPKEMLADRVPAEVRAGEKVLLAYPADWGPHADTGRVADISPGLMSALGIQTDDEVEVVYPAPIEEMVA